MSSNPPDSGISEQSGTWTFMTNHMRVLVCLAQEPMVRVRDVADRIGITERAAQRIIADLAEAGYIGRQRVGRRNRYTVNRELAVRHASQLGQEIGPLLDVLGGSSPTPSGAEHAKRG